MGPRLLSSCAMKSTDLLEKPADELSFNQTTSDSTISTPVHGVLERSDTSDSLSLLTRRSSTLNHLSAISSLPSPVTVISNEKEFPLYSPRPVRRIALHNIPKLSMSKCDNLENDTEEKLFITDSRASPAYTARASARNFTVPVEPSVREIESFILRSRSKLSIGSSSTDAGEHDGMQREHSLAHHQLNDQNGQNELPEGQDIIPRHYSNASRESERFEIPYRGGLLCCKALKEIGEGTFSRVVLAQNLTNEKQLVAIKVVALAASGEADRERVIMTVRREAHLLEKLRHPLVIDLVAHHFDQDWAHIVLAYAVGGDLFDLAAERKNLLTLRLIRRIFAESVCAIKFMHSQNVVHRDIKLENILLRRTITDLKKFNEGEEIGLITTVTDFGLAREIDPQKPDIVTRCGSDDYAAPEIHMGQTYDGRATDTWALGVLLYAMMEGRLPFDVVPGMEHRMKQKASFRICKLEWRWLLFKQKGSYDAAWDGPKRIVTHILKSRKNRWNLETVAEDEWLRDEIKVVNELIAQSLPENTIESL